LPWKTQGVTFQPWREDVRLGAVRVEDGLLVSVRSERPWKGRLTFDRPRHADGLKLPSTGRASTSSRSGSW